MVCLDFEVWIVTVEVIGLVLCDISFPLGLETTAAEESLGFAKLSSEVERLVDKILKIRENNICLEIPRDSAHSSKRVRKSKRETFPSPENVKPSLVMSKRFSKERKERDAENGDILRKGELGSGSSSLEESSGRDEEKELWSLPSDIVGSTEVINVGLDDEKVTRLSLLNFFRKVDFKVETVKINVFRWPFSASSVAFIRLHLRSI
ncbi:hypothetical protein FQA39_LY13906 [Lamprigera yunnana]|nr:hypothetical protein FQA39_LY13906 [Lamprigera yunnana]